MVDPTAQVGEGVPQASSTGLTARLTAGLSIGLSCALSIAHDIPDRRQVTRHAGMNLRQEPVPPCRGQGIDRQARVAQIVGRGGLDGPVYRGAAGLMVLGVVARGIALGKNLLQRFEKPGVGGVVHLGHRGGVSDQYCLASVVGAGS